MITSQLVVKLGSLIASLVRQHENNKKKKKKTTVFVTSLKTIVKHKLKELQR